MFHVKPKCVARVANVLAVWAYSGSATRDKYSTCKNLFTNIRDETRET
jgi:hypothetical protein